MNCTSPRTTLRAASLGLAGNQLLEGVLGCSHHKRSYLFESSIEAVWVKPTARSRPQRLMGTIQTICSLFNSRCCSTRKDVLSPGEQFWHWTSPPGVKGVVSMALAEDTKPLPSGEEGLRRKPISNRATIVLSGSVLPNWAKAHCIKHRKPLGERSVRMMIHDIQTICPSSGELVSLRRWFVVGTDPSGLCLCGIAIFGRSRFSPHMC